MYGLSRFLTHYFEADKGPFRNICDLSDEQIELIIEAEKGAETAFNRFALGSDFFKLRRAADDLLVEKYAEKFGVKPRIRPFRRFGSFRSNHEHVSRWQKHSDQNLLLSPEHVTFMYPDHFHLAWSKGLFLPEVPYSCEPFHDLLLTYAELPVAIRTYHLDARIEEAKRRGMWTHSYIEAHIWDPDIKVKLGG